MEQKCGGYTGSMEAGAGIQKLCDEVKEEVLKRSGLNLKEFEMYKALQYRSQVVAGVNYSVKIQINSRGECIHLQVFQDLRGKNHVRGIQTNQTLEGPV